MPTFTGRDKWLIESAKRRSLHVKVHRAGLTPGVECRIEIRLFNQPKIVGQIDVVGFSARKSITQWATGGEVVTLAKPATLNPWIKSERAKKAQRVYIEQDGWYRVDRNQHKLVRILPSTD
jgi:hypothetical protein